MRKPLGIATVTVILLGLVLAAWRTGGDAADRVAPREEGARGGPGQEARGPEGGASREAAGTSAQEGIGTSAQEGIGTSAQEAAGTPAQLAPLGQTAERAIIAHNAAIRGPRQPIPFSHRFHVGELQIDCVYCHAGTERSPTALVPPLEVCMGCHQVAGAGLDPVEEMKQYWARREPIPWERVHDLPDFVQFKHQPHLRTGIACQTCHGPVEEMDRVYRWAPLTMGWCLECHRSEPEEGDVATDHVLVRQDPPPEPPPGRQPLSLYPIAIDQKYGAYRGPIDCLVCHY